MYIDPFGLVDVPAGEWARICDIPNQELGNVSPTEVIDVPDDTFLDAMMLRGILGLDTGDWEEYIREAGANQFEANMRAAEAQRRSAELRRAAGTLRAPRTVEQKMANHNLTLGSNIDADSRMGDAVAGGNAVIYTGAAISAVAAPHVSPVVKTAWQGTKAGARTTVEIGNRAARKTVFQSGEFLYRSEMPYVIGRLVVLGVGNYVSEKYGGSAVTPRSGPELFRKGIVAVENRKRVLDLLRSVGLVGPFSGSEEAAE